MISSALQSLEWKWELDDERFEQAFEESLSCSAVCAAELRELLRRPQPILRNYRDHIIQGLELEILPVCRTPINVSDAISCLRDDDLEVQFSSQSLETIKFQIDLIGGKHFFILSQQEEVADNDEAA